MADVQDVLIVGGGAADTAGIFAARDRCRARLLEKFSAGGQVLNCAGVQRMQVPGGLVPLDERGQIVTSAGDGATAALAAVQYLRDSRWAA
jgi:thioredoxin reductase